MAARPLKDLTAAKVHSYIRLQYQTDFETAQITPAYTLQGLARQYFENLETQFPSLVATVNRTTEKLALPYPGPLCIICNMSREDAHNNAAVFLENTSVTSLYPNAKPPIIDIQSNQKNFACDIGEDIGSLSCYGCFVCLKKLCYSMALFLTRYLIPQANFLCFVVPW